MFTHDALLAEIGKLQKFSLHLTKNKSDADDLLQSTCLRALEKENSYENGTNLFGWMSKIMFNLFVTDYRRKTKFETRCDPEKILENITVQPMQEISSDVSNINRAMLKLKSNHQEILDMICVKGMHYKEVSKILRIPVGTVRSRLSRARKELHAVMQSPLKQKFDFNQTVSSNQNAFSVRKAEVSSYKTA